MGTTKTLAVLAALTVATSVATKLRHTPRRAEQ